jgi:hypothetical protein
MAIKCCKFSIAATLALLVAIPLASSHTFVSTGDHVLRSHMRSQHTGAGRAPKGQSAPNPNYDPFAGMILG